MDATSVESIALISNNNNNTNTMSCGSSSSSSASSGYASATTTPTNPASVGSQYADTHSTAPVGMVEPRSTAVPTIATISPYYNETYQQQQQQQQPQQQRQPTHTQQPPTHAATQQEYHQQHQTHSYQLAEQMQSPTLSQYSNSASNSSYDTPNTYLGSTVENYAPPTTEMERNLLGMRHTTAFYTTTLDKASNRMPHTTQLGTPTTPLSHLTANTFNPNNNNNKNYNSSNESGLSLSQQKRSVGEVSTHAAKPQATATPFYAQPTHASNANAYPESYKNNATKLHSHKLSSHSIDYTNYGNAALLDATPYAQSFTPYHGSKMLQDMAYGTGQAKQLTSLTNVRMPQQRLHYGSNTSMPIGVNIGGAAGGSGSAGVGSGSAGVHANGAYIDKYVYGAVSAAPATSYYTATQPGANLAGVPYNNVTYAVAPPTGAPATMPPQYGAEMPRDTYRKPTAAASSWHWSMEYPNGNCLPPPPPPPQAGAADAAATHGGLPTAAIPPTNASFVPRTNLNAHNSRDIYYATDKYNNNKYDKYNTYYNPHQQYTSGRSVWTSTPPHAATHLVPAQLTERLPPHPHSHPHHAYAPHHASTLSPGGGGATYPHAYTVAPPPHTAGTRQNCWSQTFQTQNCYYPRTAHYPAPASFFANTYNPQPIQYAVTAATAAVGRSVSNNSTGKYSMLDYAHASKPKVNTNDLYAGAGATASNTPPNYDAASLNYHAYQPTPHNQQQYTHTHATAAESALSASSDPATAYYNDLNMQPTYENYLEPLQAPALIQQRRESLVQRVEHLPNLAIPYAKQPQTTLTGAMVDYQKHTTGAAINDDCFMGSGGVTLTNLDEHMATNMHSNYESGAFGELENAAEKTDIPTTPTTKTYSSLRDFLSTWNEDEDDYGCAAELKFVENETQQLVVEQEVLRTVESNSRVELAAEQPRIMEPTQPAHNMLAAQAAKATYQTQPQNLASSVEAQVKLVAKNEKDANNAANINLPDIIIDIEKSSVVAPPTTQTTAPHVSSAKSGAKSTLYNIFDVEKELDELVTKKIKLPTKTTPDAPHIRSTGSVIKKVENEAQCAATKVREITSESMFEQVAIVENVAVAPTHNLKTFDAFEYVDTTLTTTTTCVHPLVTVKNVQERAQEALTSAVQVKPDSTCDRGMESESTTNSNGSTFEKEYETFINKIGNVLDVKVSNSIESVIETPDISSDVPQLVESGADVEPTKDANMKFTKQNSDSDLDIAQKIKSYSKFYKRKRTYSASNKDNECKKLVVIEKTNAQLNSNFPLTYTKRCRKRARAGAIHKIRLKALRARLTKFYSYYQRRMRTLRRYDTLKWKRLYTKALLKQYISTKLLENSVQENKKGVKIEASKQETQAKRSVERFEPESLKCLCVSFINSDMFRTKLLKAKDLQREVNVQKNFIKNAEVLVEYTNAAEEKEYMKTTQQEINEKSNNAKRTLETRDMTADLNDKQSDSMQNDCKKLKLDANVDHQMELTAEKKNDFEENVNVTSTDYFEKTTENEKVLLASNEVEEENSNVKTTLTLQQQTLEKSTTRLMKDDIDDEEAQIEQQANNTELVVAENETNAKEFDGSFEIHKMLENAMDIKTLEANMHEGATDTTEYQNSAEQEEEIVNNRNETTKEDDNEETIEIRKAVESENIMQETWGVAEQLENEKQVLKDFTLNLTADEVNQPKLQEMTIDSTAADNATTSIQDVEYGTMELRSSTTYDHSPLNTNEESFGCFSEHELETISLHLRSYSNQSNSESKLEDFTSPTETEAITKSHSEKDNNNENAMDITAKEVSDNEIEHKSSDREHDFSETDNSVDMFGARKYAEYFTTESKNYFQHSSNIDETSTDSCTSSSSSSSETSSTSSTDCKSASTSSTSSTSSDEDTQSSTTTEHSIFNEMKELKKELSQNQINEMNSLWLETEEEQKTEAAAKHHIENNSSNEVAYEKPIENVDVKTLKNILERESEEHEDMEIVADNKKQYTKLNADKDTRSLEHKENNAVIAKAIDNDETNEVNNGAVTRRDDIVCFDAVKEVLDDATKQQNYVGEIENVVKDVCANDARLIDEDNSMTLTHLPTTIKNKHDNENVMSLKNIALDFLERENSIKRTEDELKNSKIPKLSDLCKNALSSSFELSSITTTTNIPNQNSNAPDKLEHELSVEEALAEMYRQVGVTSDIDDEDGTADDADVKEAQDVVLINLEEILVNDSDLYVLQCDMNENVLNVVTQTQANNLTSMIISEDIVDDIESTIQQTANEDESTVLESLHAAVEMRNNALTTTTTDYRGPFMGAIDEDINSVEQQLESVIETNYTYTPTQTHTLEFIDEHTLHTQFDDFPTIHHEEIVSQDSKRYKRQLLYNSLREKYVLRRMNFRIQHGNRVLKKYINRWILQCLIARFRERELRKVQQLYLKE